MLQAGMGWGGGLGGWILARGKCCRWTPRLGTPASSAAPATVASSVGEAVRGWVVPRRSISNRDRPYSDTFNSCKWPESDARRQPVCGQIVPKSGNLLNLLGYALEWTRDRFPFGTTKATRLLVQHSTTLNTQLLPTTLSSQLRPAPAALLCHCPLRAPLPFTVHF